MAWLKQLAGFEGVAKQWPDLDLDRILGEMSRLNGIMNIEAGVDGEELLATFLQRLAKRGIEISSEQFTAITDPLSRIYAIPDHLHALCNMLGDGLVPSNAKAGYLARMLARRTLRMRDELGIDVSLADLALHHIEVNLGNKVMKQTHDGIATILNLEEAKYVEMLRNGEHVIKTMQSGVDKSTDTNPRPTGSVWFKTSQSNLGANLKVKNFNGNTNLWTDIGAPIYATNMAAINALYSTGGGLNLAVGTVYVQSNCLLYTSPSPRD